MIYTTYVLLCNNQTRYYGYTQNLDKRLKEHLKGHVSYTKNKSVQLVYAKKFSSLSEAVKHERQFKNGKTRKETIEKLINSYALQNVKDSISTDNLCRQEKDSISCVVIEGECRVKT